VSARKPQSIRKKLIRLQVRTAAGLLLASSVAFSAYDVWGIFAGFEARAQQLAELIGDSMIASVVFADRDSALRTLSILAKDKSVLGARVFGARSAPFVEAGNAAILDRAGSGFQFESAGFSGTYAHAHRLMQDGAEVGKIVVVYSTSAMADLIESHLLIVLAVFACGMALSLAIASYLQRLFASPIENLQKAIREIAARPDYSVRVSADAASGMEIVEMAAAFNEMLSQIERRDRLIREANESLENKVQERTRDLVEAQKALVHSAKISALGELAGSIAHEINNPLALIIGHCNMAQRRLRSGESTIEPLETDLAKIHDMAGRIGKIIKGLLSFSRDGQDDPFDFHGVNAILEDAMELCAERARHQRIDFTVRLLESDIEIECRSTQIAQVLVNLVNNSRDAIEGTPSPWIRVEARLAGEKVEISVTDSGPGIPAEVREKLATPFFSTKTAGKGTGLGLSISRGIVEAHQGKLLIDADAPNTRFVLVLPVRREKQSPSGAPQAN
jgi:C4-dicarboxylate-specific signal transduction histidine kinase